MISLIFAIIFLVLFIFFVIAGGNYLLRSVLDHVLNNTEEFTNMNPDTNLLINPVDKCRKIDFDNKDKLNFQTATNIPLSPFEYKDHVGALYTNESDNHDLKTNLELGNTYCLKKSKLLYDGIWDSKIEQDGTFLTQKWNLTNGDLSDDYYCSNKLIEVNKPIPKNFLDMSATPILGHTQMYQFINDPINDPNDTEITYFNRKDIDYPIRVFK
jgi:hypothetical protein